ncbi:IclR family transcriptional regulator [Sphingobium sp. 15-1]|uniref:IclR family transcriptional regulator n=2 Tax=Sphingobium TaxID=165695 RepID=UPI00159CB9E2
MADNKTMAQAPVDGGQSIARAVELLIAVAKRGEAGIRLSDMSAETGLHIATARRIMQALVSGGLLSFDMRTKLYFVGPAAFSVAVLGNAWFSRREDFTPVLEAIAARTRDTVMFSIRSGYEAVCLERCEGAFPIKVMSLERGSRRPLGAGSGSLAILAYLDDEERETVLRQCAPHYEAFGLSKEFLAKEVRATRFNGYAVNLGHIIEGVYGIGVPILADGVAVASISVAAIASRMDEERRKDIIKIIGEEAAALPDIEMPPGILRRGVKPGKVA